MYQRGIIPPAIASSLVMTMNFIKNQNVFVLLIFGYSIAFFSFLVGGSGRVIVGRFTLNFPQTLTKQGLHLSDKIIPIILTAEMKYGFMSIPCPIPFFCVPPRNLFIAINLTIP
jgi:hypothetical protein